MISILNKKPTLIMDPYPHFIIEDALPQDLYDTLEKEWPKEELLSTTPFDNGICYRLKADEMLKPTKVSKAWKEFTEYHMAHTKHRMNQSGKRHYAAYDYNPENDKGERKARRMSQEELNNSTQRTPC